MSARRVFALLAALYPPAVRAFESEMVDFMTERHARALRDRRLVRFWLELATDTLRSLIRDWFEYLAGAVRALPPGDLVRAAIHESGLRFLRRRKAAAAMVVVTLGLALGANNLAVAMVDAFLLSSFGIPESDKVVIVVPSRDIPALLPCR